ncbi:MAG: DUF4403 family protein [Saprospiraceae bacterium]
MTNSKNSKINILVSLDKEQLQQVIGQQLPVDLLSRFSPEGSSDIRISVRRKGKIDLTAENNNLKYEVPLELFVQKNTMLGNVDVLFEMYLGFETKFLFKDNWELMTRTQMTGYQWINKPEIDLGLFNIPLDNTVLNAIQGNKEMLCQQVDDKIKEVGDIRPKLNQMLSILPNPIPTPAGEQVWWQCETVKTSMSPLFEKEGFIYGKIALEGVTEFSYGNPLEKLTTVVKSPDIVPDVEKESHLQTLLSVNFRAIEKSALALLQKQSFEFKSQKVQVEAVRVEQVGQRLKVAADLKGSFDGEMILLGKPVFDSSKNEIQLKEVDLDLKGHNFLSKTMVVFLRKVVEDKISTMLNFPIQKSIDFANQKVKYVTFQDGLFAKGKINAVDIPHVEVQTNALVISLSVKGYLQLGLEARSGLL